CEAAIRQSTRVRSMIKDRLDAPGELRVCAFGGGPGTELLALAKHIIKSGRVGPPAMIEFTLIERVKEWCETWNALESEIKKQMRSKFSHSTKWPFMISKTFLSCDMLKLEDYANMSQVLTHDLYIMNYVVSEVIASTTAFQSVVNRMAKAAPKGSLFLVIDRDQDTIRRDANDYLQTAGLKVGACVASSTNMDGDEQISDLDPYSANIGRKPRVQWGTTGKQGAFWVVGEKM
ncbi:MAG: hypothetical protein ABL959_24000, partial [Pyrinomonadaceae bacterium]